MKPTQSTARLFTMDSLTMDPLTTDSLTTAPSTTAPSTTETTDTSPADSLMTSPHTTTLSATSALTTHQLAIQARFRPEILERVLRVVRHRGFRVYQLNMATQSDNINIELTVASLRPVELLFSQLTRLADVAEVEIQPNLTSPRISASGATHYGNSNI